MADSLLVHEIYLSIQGESTFAGLPCIFVRLTGCDLRCSYCDTAYAFTGGQSMIIDEVIAELENAEARIRRAWHNVATAQVLLTHARVRRYPRGEPFFEIRDRVTFLEAERDTAEDEFLALVERTRRGGMPAGTLSTFMDFSDEIRRDRASRNAKP